LYNTVASPGMTVCSRWVEVNALTERDAARRETGALKANCPAVSDHCAGALMMSREEYANNRGVSYTHRHRFPLRGLQPTGRWKKDVSLKIHLFMALLITAMGFVIPALALDSAQSFVNKAVDGSMFEVGSSRLAEGRMRAAAVKDFAKSMIADHGSSNANLAAIASRQKLTVPKKLDLKHKTDIELLQSGKGPVDNAYIQMQLHAHINAVELFESYARDGDNAELKAFAQRTLPTLKIHQETIEKIAGANSSIENQAKERFSEAQR
jgi:predicted outer membrane protein